MHSSRIEATDGAYTFASSCRRFAILSGELVQGRLRLRNNACLSTSKIGRNNELRDLYKYCWSILLVKCRDGLGLKGAFTNGGCASTMQEWPLIPGNWYVDYAAIRQTALSGSIACREVIPLASWKADRPLPMAVPKCRTGSYRSHPHAITYIMIT